VLEKTRTPASQEVALQAWRLLEANYERVLREPTDLAARDAMLLGAHRAGAAIEMSMLGATHACANPLTATYGTTHGVAIAVMLPSVGIRILLIAPMSSG
jgi:alcohol dehydrogenase